MLNITKPFVNNIGIKGFKTRYKKEKIFPKIRRFIFEHIINIDKFLFNYKLAEAIINIIKL